MKFGMFRVALPYFDGENPGGAPAAPAPTAPTGGTPSAPAPGAPTGQPAAPAAQPQAPRGFTYREDRSNWIPPHVNRKYVDMQQKLERELFQERQRVAALSGVAPLQAPVDPETAAIREQFTKLFPGLAKLEGLQEKLEKLTSVDFEKIQQTAEGSTNRMWEMHGNQMSRILLDKAKEVYGGADLGDKAKGRLINAFVWELQNDDELRQRYEAGDTGVLDDFLNDYKGTNLEPYRKTTAAAAAPGIFAARRLPRGGGSSAVVGARPATLKPSDPNFHKSAFDRFRGEQG